MHNANHYLKTAEIGMADFVPQFGYVEMKIYLVPSPDDS
jgi:hypothetical protein